MAKEQPYYGKLVFVGILFHLKKPTFTCYLSHKKLLSLTNFQKWPFCGFLLQCRECTLWPRNVFQNLFTILIIKYVLKCKKETFQKNLSNLGIFVYLLKIFCVRISQKTFLDFLDFFYCGQTFFL